MNYELRKIFASMGKNQPLVPRFSFIVHSFIYRSSKLCRAVPNLQGIPEKRRRRWKCG